MMMLVQCEWNYTNIVAVGILTQGMDGPVVHPEQEAAQMQIDYDS